MTHEADARRLRRALRLPRATLPAIERALDAEGGLLGLVHAGPGALASVSAAAPRRMQHLNGLLDRLHSAPLPRVRIADADQAAQYFRTRLGHLAVESFWVLLLDARLGVLGEACVARGTLTACLVHPREVFALAIRRRAAQILVVHNHPSGDPTPSAEDLALTERLTEGGAMLGIPVIDHVVVARQGHRSIGVPQRAISGALAEPIRAWGASRAAGQPPQGALCSDR